jgi:hypothetical protein
MELDARGMQGVAKFNSLIRNERDSATMAIDGDSQMGCGCSALDPLTAPIRKSDLVVRERVRIFCWALVDRILGNIL